MSGYLDKVVEGSYTHTLRIPNSWVFVELKEAVDIVGGSQPPKSEFHSEDAEGLIRLIQIRDYKSDKHKVYIPLEKAKRFVSPVEIMIGRYGPPIFQILRGLEGAYNVALMKAIPVEGVLENEFLFYFLSNRDIYNYVESASDRTAGQSGVNKKHLEKYPVGIPPLAEQKVIADKLNELLAQVESTKARLDAIPAILKSFSQSVLTAAMSGKLTEEWRGENATTPISNILKQVDQLRTDKKSEKFASKPFRSDEITLEIPSSWEWVRLAKIAEVVSGVAKGSKSKDELIDLPYLRVANVQRGYLDLEEIKFISVSSSKAKNLYLKADDILFNEGGDIDKLGRGWIWEGQVNNCIHQNHVFRARTYLQEIQSKYISHYGNSEGKEYFLREGTQSVNLANINKTTLSLLPIPLPPLEEQEEIIRRVDELFAFADKIETQVNAAQERVNNLTQSILAKAFRGELTADWRAANPEMISGDHSAEALLRKIKAERDALSAKKKPVKKARAKKVTD